MHRITALALFLAAASCSPAAPLVPEFGSMDASAWVNGAPMSLREAKGSVVLVEAWDQLCVTCRESVPQVLALKARYEPRGLRVVSVSNFEGDSPNEAKEIADAAREEHMSYPCYLDKGAAWQKKVGTTGEIPYFFVVGRDGRLAFKHLGRLGEGAPETAEVSSAIERALAASP